MVKYTERFKLSVVEDFDSGRGGSVRAVAHRHGIDGATVREWAAAYEAHGVAGIKRKHEVYSTSFKLSGLQQIEDEGLSDRAAAARLNIRNRSTIGQWRQQYDDCGIAALSAGSSGRPRKMPPALPEKPTEVLTPDERPREALLKEIESLRVDGDRHAEFKARIQAVYTLHKGRYGFRRVTAAIWQSGQHVNHKTV